MAGQQPAQKRKRKRNSNGETRIGPKVPGSSGPSDSTASSVSAAPRTPSVSAVADARRSRTKVNGTSAPAPKVTVKPPPRPKATGTKPTHAKVPAKAAPPTMSSEGLSRERRLGWPAGVCGLAVTVLTIAAVPVAASGPRIFAPAGSDKLLLLGASLAGHAQLTAMWMRVASVLLVIPVAIFLRGTIVRRNPQHLRVITILGVVAFVIVGASTAVGFFEVRDAAHVYITSGARTTARASHVLTLQRDKGPLRIADVGQLVGGLLFGLWISVISWEAMRVGLLTRFLGMFGIGAGLTTVIGIAIGPALFIGWLASVSCLAVGYWPGGRPLAWNAGRAVSLDETDAAVMPRRSTTRR